MRYRCEPASYCFLARQAQIVRAKKRELPAGPKKSLTKTLQILCFLGLWDPCPQEFFDRPKQKLASSSLPSPGITNQGLGGRPGECAGGLTGVPCVICPNGQSLVQKFGIGSTTSTMLTQPAATVICMMEVELSYVSPYIWYYTICWMLHILWGPDPDHNAKRFVVAFADPREFIKQECTTLECTRRADIWQRSIQGSNQLSNSTKC